MGKLLKVMHWYIENIQALSAQFVALAVFLAIAKSNLKNKRAGKSTKLSYFDCDLIENLDEGKIRTYEIFRRSREEENAHFIDLKAC